MENIDVNEDPAAAQRHGVFVTPSGLRLHPRPQKRVRGRIADLEHVLTALDRQQHRRSS